MLIRISTALLAFILAGLVPLHGQGQTTSADTPGPIVTDRPADGYQLQRCRSVRQPSGGEWLPRNRQTGAEHRRRTGDLSPFWCRHEDRVALHRAGLLLRPERWRPQLGIRRLGHRSKRTAWFHAR